MIIIMLIMTMIICIILILPLLLSNCSHITLFLFCLYYLVFGLHIFSLFCGLRAFIIYLLFIFGCVGSSLLCEGFLQLRQVGVTLHRDAWASHYRGLSCCGTQAPEVQAQQLWLTGLAAPRHVGFSQTRTRTRVPCIGRQILNHCTTREALRAFKQ